MKVWNLTEVLSLPYLFPNFNITSIQLTFPFEFVHLRTPCFFETRNSIFTSQTSRHENRGLSKQRSLGFRCSFSLLKINHDESLEFYRSAVTTLLNFGLKHCFHSTYVPFQVYAKLQDTKIEF